MLPTSSSAVPGAGAPAPIELHPLLLDFNRIGGAWARACRDDDLPRAERLLDALRGATDRGDLDARSLDALLWDIGGTGASHRLIDDALTRGSAALVALTGRCLARLVTAGQLDIRDFRHQLNADGVGRRDDRVHRAPLTGALLRGEHRKVPALCDALLDEVDGRLLTLDDVADVFDQHVDADRGRSRPMMIKLAEDGAAAGIRILDDCARRMAARGMPVHRVRRLYLVDAGATRYSLDRLRCLWCSPRVVAAMEAYDEVVTRAGDDGLLCAAAAPVVPRRASPAPATR